MEKFPDQFQMNEFIRRIDQARGGQLKAVHHQLFVENARCVSSTDEVVVNIDQSSIVANGKTYEATEKRCFSKMKNQKDYQLSAACCGGKNSETYSIT